jgi:hypothetical protein
MTRRTRFWIDSESGASEGGSTGGIIGLNHAAVPLLPWAPTANPENSSWGEECLASIRLKEVLSAVFQSTFDAIYAQMSGVERHEPLPEPL